LTLLLAAEIQVLNAAGQTGCQALQLLRCHAGEQIRRNPVETVLLIAAGCVIALTSAIVRTLIVVRLGPAVLPVLATIGSRGVSVGIVTSGCAARWVTSRRQLASIELHASHPLDRLFALDPLLFTSLQDLLVLDTKLATGDVVAIQSNDDGISLVGVTEVGKSESSEDTIIVMVVEGIRQRSLETLDDGQEGLFLHRERNILDHDGGRDDLIVDQLADHPLGIGVARIVTIDGIVR